MRKVVEETKIMIRIGTKNSFTGSWRELERKFLKEAKAQITGSTYEMINANGQRERYSCPIDKIVLTGGASNMDFIVDDCQEIFPDIEVIRDKENSSYTVAKGLGWTALSEEQLDTCTTAAISEVKEIQSCSFSALRENISDKVFSCLCNIFQIKVREWADLREENVPINRLKDMIEGIVYANDNNSEKQKYILFPCTDVINSWKDNLALNICDAVNAQAEKIFSDTTARGLMLPVDVWRQFQAQNLNFNDINISSILGSLDFSGVMAKLMKQVISIAIWAAAGWFAPATFGTSFIAAFVLDVIVDVFFTDDNLDKPRSRDKRQKIANSLVEKLKEKKIRLNERF